MSLCIFTLKLLLLAAGVMFWAWYLLWEYEHYSGRRKAKRWWEKHIKW